MGKAIKTSEQLYFTKDHDMVRRALKEFVDKEINPYMDEWEEQGIAAPRGIAIDESNNVYVCSVKGYIQKLTTEGVLITEFGDSGSEPGYIAGPNGIEVDSAERIYVAETNNNRIQVFTKVSP